MSGHELRFYAELGADGRAQLIAQCGCLQLRTALDNGHSLPELCRLAAQHDPQPPLVLPADEYAAVAAVMNRLGLDYRIAQRPRGEEETQ